MRLDMLSYPFCLCLLLYRIAELYGVYGDGTFNTDVAYPYVVFVNNISQFTAMYCLVLFYKANKVSYSTNIDDFWVEHMEME